MSKGDGRWRATACSAALPTACRSANGTWSLQQGPRGQCPKGSAFQLPQHGKENTALHRALQQSRDAATAAWLPLQGVLYDQGCMAPTAEADLSSVHDMLLEAEA